MKRAAKQLAKARKNAGHQRALRSTPRLDHMPFATDFTRSRLPNGTLGGELVKGAFLGFRRHAVNRFIKALDIHSNEVVERARMGLKDPNYARSPDGVLISYLQRMPIDQLIVLYQLNLKCTTANSEIKYTFIEAISHNVATYMRNVTTHDTVGCFLDVTKQGLRTYQKKYSKETCDFFFQSRDDLLRSREEAMRGDNTSGGHDAHRFLTITGIRASQELSRCATANLKTQSSPHTDDTSPETFTGDLNGGGEPSNEGCSPSAGDVGSVLDDRGYGRVDGSLTAPIHPQTKSEDCMISNNLMAVVFGHIANIKFWHRGFPFNIWINQYFAHNAVLYHPVFAKLYMANVVSLLERNANSTEVEPVCDAVKNDLCQYISNQQAVEEKMTTRLSGRTYETTFGVHELVEIFATVKRLLQNPKVNEAYPWVVSALTDVVAAKPFDAKIASSIANICNRNDGATGLETLLETLEAKLLENLEDVTCLDVCGMLQAMYKHGLHSQELIDALALKLNADDLDEMSMATIALCIQTLGRMQANLRSTAFLHRIAEMIANNPQKFIETSESNCSGILWGFYKLHFKHSKFLDAALQRYSTRDLGTPNVNSMVISLTALTRFDSFRSPVALIEIYKLVLRNISSMTISTSQQLVTLVTRMQENITVCCADNENYKILVSISNKLINATMKHVCERFMDQISTVQAGAMLNALHRSRQRTHDIIAPLVASIAGNYKKLQDWNSSQHMPRKSIYAYEAVPPCPFDVDACARRIERVEATHLVGICEAIHGLDYWSPYSLHLMLQIKRHIEPQLHDMKATHILSVCISFANWPFTDFQMEYDDTNYTDGDKMSKEEMLKTVHAVVNHDLAKYRQRNESWIDQQGEDHQAGQSVVGHFRILAMKSKWKEDLLLGCIESLHRHASFLSAASLPLRRLKVLYDMVRLNMYLEDCNGAKSQLLPHPNAFSSTKCPFLILEHTPPNRPESIPTVMPQNLTDFQVQLYAISRTESFYNFIFGDGGGATAQVTNGLEDEEEGQVDSTECMELLQSGKDVPDVRPLHADLAGDENEWDLAPSFYHEHQGSGAIFKRDHTYIYVDPVIGGFRTTILLLDAKRHYVPHLVEHIYSDYS